MNLLHVANAARELQRLPEAGETIHAVMRGNFHGWDLVPAVLQLAAPATIARLYVATLGFNQKNATDLLDMLDRGRVARVTFICSCYFRDSSAADFTMLETGLRERGQTIRALRTHAKIIAIETTDGRGIVIESSANLRSCRNIEQFAMTNDLDLLNFHAQWMEEITRG